jgi:hypothetical protein
MRQLGSLFSCGFRRLEESTNEDGNKIFVVAKSATLGDSEEVERSTPKEIIRPGLDWRVRIT